MQLKAEVKAVYMNLFTWHLLLFLLAVNCVALEAEHEAQQPLPVDPPPEAVEPAAIAFNNHPENQALPAGRADLNATPPDDPQRLIFIHHSTGENWLSDGNGQLGMALRDNNYFVSDTNYGWGVGDDIIGDRTDIGNWYEWFAGPKASTYLSALYRESGQNCEYSRLDASPRGNNTIVMFKSCFPNSALQGRPSDIVPDISRNPLKGESAGSEYHTVANAKGIYIELLNYFKTKQDKLFVVITAPPLSDATYAANARLFNQWLYTEWLANYPYKNVAVFDFYNVLTTNGGDPDVNDLNLKTGNHHRYFEGAIQHIIAGDDDLSPNITEYPSGDDHPSQAGNLKATEEFLPLLNIFWHCWTGTGACPETGGGSTETVPDPPQRLAATSRGAGKVHLQWASTSNNVVEFIVSRRVGTDAWEESFHTLDNLSRSFDDNAATSNPTTKLYSYMVRACNAAGCSDNTPLALVPFAPIKLNASFVSGSGITLKWSPRPGSSQNGYKVFRKQGPCAGSGWGVVKALTGTRTTWVDTTASSGQQYSYKVQATRANGSPNVSWGYSLFTTCVSIRV